MYVSGKNATHYHNKLHKNCNYSTSTNPFKNANCVFAIQWSNDYK